MKDHRFINKWLCPKPRKIKHIRIVLQTAQSLKLFSTYKKNNDEKY